MGRVDLAVFAGRTEQVNLADSAPVACRAGNPEGETRERVRGAEGLGEWKAFRDSVATGDDFPQRRCGAKILDSESFACRWIGKAV